MSENKSWNTIGEEIRDAIGQSLQTGDFSGIGDAVSQTVRDCCDKAGQEVSKAQSRYQEKYGTRKYGTKKYGTKKYGTGKYGTAGKSSGEEVPVQVKRQVPFVRVGRVSGTLYQVFGGIGTTIMAVMTAVFLGLGIGLGGGFLISFFVFFIVLLVFCGMIRLGCTQKFRLRRAEKYLQLSGNNHYINVDDLAEHTGKTRKYVLKDIHKMLDSGFFPEGHLDRQETCLMLEDTIYQEYLDLEKQRKELEQSKVQETPAEKGEPSELEEMIAEGKSCIKRLREMNDNIPGEEISAKLFRLETVLGEIFDGLSEHPEQAGQMHKFMNYYLPTTLKLVSAYEEFDDLSSQGEEILEAKQEIEKTLDTINSAFEELLNRMFRETAYDVTTDAQVLQTMLAKEGLTGSAFSKK